MQIRGVWLAVLAISVACLTNYGQSFKFRNYSLQDGLADPFIYTIDQDSSGYLWIGTGEGLMRYDGKAFREFASPDIPSKALITCSFNTGSNIIYGFDNGALVRITNGEVRSITGNSPLLSRINSITELPGGELVASTQDKGLVLFNRDNVLAEYHQGVVNKMIFDAETMDDGKVLLATDEGVLLVDLVESGGNHLVNIISSVGSSSVSDIERVNDNLLFVGFQDEGVQKLLLHDDHLVLEPELKEELGDAQIRSLRFDGKHLWISTFEGLFKGRLDQNGDLGSEIVIYDERNGLGTAFIQLTFEDREGNIWVGTYGAGLSHLVDEYFMFYFDRREGKSNNVTAILVEDSVKWFGVGNELRKIRAGKQPPFIIYDETAGLPEDHITAIYRSTDGRLWVGYEKSGLYLLHEHRRSSTKVNLGVEGLSESINDIVQSNQELYVATFDGLFKIALGTNSIEHITTEQGLRHNTIYCLVKDAKNNVWIGTKSNTLTKINEEGMEEFFLTKGEQLISLVSITLSDKGEFWIATESNGVVRFNPDTKEVLIYSERNNLLSNYCYSIAQDGKGRVWIGHRAGLSRIDPKSNRIQVYDSKYGLISENNRNSISGDDQGNVWFGTRNGLIKYDPSKDRGLSVPPGIDINSMLIDDELVERDRGNIDLPFDEYEITFNFKAITFKSPDEVVYYYRLKGHEKDWVFAGNATFASYTNLPDGQYQFMVRACNKSGACAEQAYPVSITIDKPYYKKWWFYALIVVGVVLVVATVAFFRERNLRNIKIYLEKQLTYRTKEVVKQKEIIEEKNKDITDSINYAERIQSSMLPDDQQFKEVFPNSFVINRPRDIVSGDFYWFDQRGAKALLVCADCTGHGVPGALMSMIGTVSLRSITALNEVTSPSDILYALDNEVNTVLNQDLNADDFLGSRDGMDITICEIDLTKFHIRMAAAMRNSLLIINGETHLFRGDRWSIGGTTDDNKVFSTQEFDLSKGDSIILFSDGFIDQFGGADGKKLKMKGLTSIVENADWNSMEELRKILEEKLDEWQGNYDQMDDIIVVGITL